MMSTAKEIAVKTRLKLQVLRTLPSASFIEGIHAKRKIRYADHRKEQTCKQPAFFRCNWPVWVIPQIEILSEKANVQCKQTDTAKPVGIVPHYAMPGEQQKKHYIDSYHPFLAPRRYVQKLKELA